MDSKAETVASFIEAAPPGQVQNIVEDLRQLTVTEPQLMSDLTATLRKYNEAQLLTVEVPGSSELAIISPYNRHESSRYISTAASSSFDFDQTSQTASSIQSHALDSPHAEQINSILKAANAHVKEHYPAPSSAADVFPPSAVSSNNIVIAISASKYSLNNFWSGRWRAVYLVDPASEQITGTITVDVHYFEDGNVRMQTEKKVDVKAPGTEGADILRAIAGVERRYQEDLEKGFMQLNEGVFKGLRRQLPVTRQKVEWAKVGAYTLGQDIGGARAR